MKKIKFIISACLATIMFACNTLDVPPMNIVKDAELFGEQSGINAYFAKLYLDLPFITERPDYVGRASDVNAYDALPDEISGTPNQNDASYGWWSYTNIRAVCYFLQEFPKYRDRYNDEVAVNSWKGEALFIRAYCYFRMVQCYGGVPLVDKVLDINTQGFDELALPRDKEEDCYTFIFKDLDDAIALLPETSLARGRINKYVAYAFKARVALHAACIAKYGSPLLATYSGTPAVQQGLVGLPAAKATDYFNMAWTAAKAVEDGGKYELHGKDLQNPADVIKSYRKLFQDKDSKEILFCKYFIYPHNAIIVDANCLPYQLGGTYAMHVGLTLNFVKLFDDIDGNPVDWDNVLGNDANYSTHLYTNPADVFANMEPRFKAMVVYPNAVYKGETIEIRKGILKKDNFVDGVPFKMDSVAIAAELSARYVLRDKSDSMVIQGKSGMGNNTVTSTGFYCVKFTNEELPREQVSSSISRSEPVSAEIRYAEVLLMLAETAVELGRPNDAIPYMNAIRQRAGSKKVFTTVTLDDVRKERRMEFIWESKTYWDMKRWRTFHINYDNTTPEILWPIYIWDKDAYYLRTTNTGASDNKRISFEQRFYYLKVPDAEISKNGKLVQNPGY